MQASPVIQALPSLESARKFTVFDWIPGNTRPGGCHEQVKRNIARFPTNFRFQLTSEVSHRNHDRFLIIDNKAYLLGTSVKDIGAGLSAVTELSTSPETVNVFTTYCVPICFDLNGRKVIV